MPLGIPLLTLEKLMLLGKDRKQPEKLEFEQGDNPVPVTYPTPRGHEIIGFLLHHPLMLHDQWSVKGWEGEYFASYELAKELLVNWWWEQPDKFTYGLFNPNDWGMTNGQ